MSHLPQDMLEAHISPDTKVSLHRVPLPKLLKSTSVLIRVEAISTNPKDWKMPAGLLTTIGDCANSGDDCSGTVAAIGSAVTSVYVGQRVSAFHQLGAEYGTYAEYCLVDDFACIPIPASLPFEAAATLPMAYFMSCIALFSPSCLGIAAGPWDVRSDDHPHADQPLIIYGASTALGTMSIKLARVCGIHPIITVAGRAKQWVEVELLDKSRGDVVFDYREGQQALLYNFKRALQNKPARFAFDAVTENGSYLTLAQILEPDARIALTLPGKASKEILAADNGKYTSLKISHVMAGSIWKPLVARKVAVDAEGVQQPQDLGNLGIRAGGNDFARAMSAALAGLLADCRITPRPFEVLPGGLRGLEQALQNLRAGKNSGLSYVIRIKETSELIA